METEWWVLLPQRSWGKTLEGLGSGPQGPMVPCPVQQGDRQPHTYRFLQRPSRLRSG